MSSSSPNKTIARGKTAAALLYHALACEADARTDDMMWYDPGDPTWDAKND